MSEELPWMQGLLAEIEKNDGKEVPSREQLDDLATFVRRFPQETRRPEEWVVDEDTEGKKYTAIRWCIGATKSFGVYFYSGKDRRTVCVYLADYSAWYGPADSIKIPEAMIAFVRQGAVATREPVRPGCSS